MKVYLQALLLMFVPFAYSMNSSSSHDDHSSSSTDPSDKKQNNAYLIIKNNTNSDLWFSINAGGTFEKIIQTSDGKEGFKRLTQGTSVFCNVIEAGAVAKTLAFDVHSFVTAKVANSPDSLKKSNAVLCTKIFKPEVLSDIVVVCFDKNNGQYDFLAIEKNTMCPLCLHYFQENDEIYTLKPCGHSFHIACYNPVQKKRAYAYADAQEKYVKSQCCPFCEQLIDVDTIVEKTID